MARTIRLAMLLAGVGAAGCVDRKFIVESNVPNAQVYVDNRPVGAAPAYVPFEYYGYYTITLVHPGYQTVVRREHIAAPWYAYPPFDFLAEIVWPFNIRDTRRVHIDMFEATQVRTDDILNAAEALRQRGMTLPLPERPAAPRPPRVQPAPTIGPPVAPAPGANPLPVPAPVPAPGPAPSVVPSVVPG